MLKKIKLIVTYTLQDCTILEACMTYSVLNNYNTLNSMQH